MNTQIPQGEPAPAAPPSEMIPKKPVIALRDIALLYGLLSAGVFLFLLLFSLLIWYITMQVGHAWDFGKLLMLFDLPLFLSYIAASSWYVFRFLWKRGQLHMEEMEHDTHARSRAIEAEVRVKEREPMLVRADQLGNYPAYVNPYTRQVLRLAPGNSIVKQAKEDQMITELQPEGEQDLAKAVDYWAIAHRVPAGHALLGVDPATGEVITCDFGYLLTTWIVGGSGRGKTNTVALKVYEAVQLGYKLIVIDPHKHKDDSLAKKLEPFSTSILGEVAWKDEQIDAVLDWFLETFEERRQGRGTKEQILLIVDEVGNLARNDLFVDKIKKIARVCGQESRGFGMAGYFISQQASGLKWLRDSAITVIAHKLLMDSERLLACNNNRLMARQMDAFPVGRVVVYGQAFDDMRVLQMPIFATERMPSLLRAVLPVSLLSEQSETHDIAERKEMSGSSTLSEREENLEESAEVSLQNTEKTEGMEGAEGCREANSSDFAAEEDLLLLLKKHLRDIGRQVGRGNRILDMEPPSLRWTRWAFKEVTNAGDDRISLLKQWNVAYGRAYQEMGAAIDVLLEEQRTGRPLLATHAAVEQP